MSEQKKLGLLLAILLAAPQALAGNFLANEVLTIDEPISGNVDLEFSNDDRLEPKLSQFEIVSLLLMSNDSGERWATITLENNSAQQRLLDSEHIVAIFADGEKRYPVNVEHKFSGREVITLVMTFGRSKFPILKVYVRN